MSRPVLGALLLALASPSLAATPVSDEASAFFADGAVREIHLAFDDAGWYQTLYDAHANDEEDPYFPAAFGSSGVSIPKIGARFKGNSSFRVNGVKKSFKLDFNEYDDDARFLGLKKLNLNNLALSPDFMREKLVLDLAGTFLPAMRAVPCDLYVNGELWGLYMAVEQPDKAMMQSRFGEDEDGNLYEAGETNADLTYLGTNVSSYTSRYELDTNEEENDWSGFIAFLDVLNNTATAGLPAALPPVCDVENVLSGLAIDILFSNTDSYLGAASEYFMYQRTSDGKFVRFHWDLNEAFGTTGDGSPTVANPMQMDVFWLPTSSGGGAPPGGGPGGGGPGGSGPSGTVSRPLATKLWAVDAWKRWYLQELARMRRGGFDPDTMSARITGLADLVRPHVAADPHKLYTSAQFETALNSQVGSGPTPIYGLRQFVNARYAYLRSALDALALPTDVRLNEVVASNAGSPVDGAGDADPWVEVHNLGPGPVSLAGFWLSDDAANPKKWALPSQTLADGAFLVVWLDGETNEGSDHASFRASAAGGTLLLSSYTGSTQTLVDSVGYPALAAGQGFARQGLSGSSWSTTFRPTAGAANPAAGAASAPGSEALRINELMADNGTAFADPDEAGACEDWIEVWNPGDVTVDMTGMYLTDDLTKPTKWQVPSGVTVPAKGWVVFLADEETSQGSRHAGFKLGKSGEAVGLYQPDGATLVDSVTFGAQTTDVSWGRYPDGGSDWVLFSPSTPGAANLRTSWVAATTSWLPVAVHSSGASSSAWRTDVGVLNRATIEANVEVRFHASGGAKSLSTKVPASGQLLLGDVVSLLGSSGAGPVEVLSDQDVHVTSRTYSLIPSASACGGGGTVGLDLGAAKATAGLSAGESAYLTPLVENGRFRTNVALANASGSAASATVSLHDAAGNPLVSYDVTLASGEWTQEDRPFATRAGRSDLDGAWAKVTATSGAGLFAYATVIDDATNDPTAVPMRRSGASSASATSGTGLLLVNEVMADNDAAFEDPDEAGAYEDWVELYNPGSSAVDMGGMYLTDDLTKPTKWQVPAGVSVPAKGHVVFLADEETAQGARHAGFKLSKGGEAVGLFLSDGATLVDSVTFGAQATNVSFGRFPDGGSAWASLSPATAGAANRLSTWLPVATHADGAGTSAWRTDVGLLNPGAEAVDAEVRFLAPAGTSTRSVTLAAGHQTVLADLVASLGSDGSAPVEVRAGRPLLVTSRTYTSIDASAACFPGGTLGLDLPSATAAEGLSAGETGWLAPLSEDAQYRTNVAFANAGTEDARVTVTLVDAEGNDLTGWTIDLAAGAWVQENRPFAQKAGRSSLTAGTARVTVVSGSGVLAYATVVDNVTNDPTTVSLAK